MSSRNTRKVLLLFPLLLVIILSAQVNVLADDDWTIIQSKNFKMIGNAGEKDMQRVATKLEQFRHVFTQIFSRMKFNSPIPTNVIVFKNEKSFRDFKPVEDGKRRDWVAGYFQPGEDVNYIVLSTDGEKEETYRIIFHEYTHYLVNNTLGKSNVPPWINEGLAEYYEQFEIKDDQQVRLGGINSGHLALLQRSKFIPLEEFFNIDYYSLNRQTKDGVGIFYAQSWALMHYLLQGDNGARKDQMTKFLDLILSGKPPKESFETAFKTNYAAMEKDLKKYVENRRFMTSLLTFKDKLIFESDMTVSKLSEADALAYQGDLLYHSNRNVDAAVYLEKALVLDPKSGLANTAMGLIKMRQEKFSEARKFIEKAVEFDSENYAVHYSYAYILSREGMTEGGFVRSYKSETDELMRRSLRKAILLNPNFAESYNLYAFISIVQNTELDEAIAMLKKALEIAPGNQWYSMRIGELYVRKKDFTTARNLVSKVFETASDIQLRNYAEGVLRNIDSMESRTKTFEKYNNQQTTLTIESDKPLTPKELAKKKKELQNKTLNQMIRKPLADEKRIVGFITKIDCKDDKIEYLIQAKTGNLKLYSKEFQNILITGINVDLGKIEVGCESSFPNTLSVITFRQTTKDNIPNEIISIEFLPNDFELEEVKAKN